MFDSEKVKSWISSAACTRILLSFSSKADTWLERTFEKYQLHVDRKRMTLALAGLVLVAVIGGFVFAYLNFMVSERIRKDPASATQNLPIDLLANDADAEEGITILAKRQPAGANPAEPVYAPVASGAAKASGFAMDLGSAQAFDELSKRFGELVAQNPASTFEQLEPRAVLLETITGLEARLLAGPFASLAEAEKACKAIAMPDGLICKAVPFDGELIERQ